MKLVRIPIITVLSLSLLAGCYYDVEEELYPSNACDVTGVTYSTTVRLLLVDRCYKCHSQAARQGGIILEGYDNLKRYVDSGQFLGSIRYETGFSPMPRDEGKLSDCLIARIEEWVRQGAPDN